MRAQPAGRAVVCWALLASLAYGQLPAVGDYPLTKTQAALHGAISVANLHGIAASRAGAGFTWGAGGPWLGVSLTGAYSNTKCIAAPNCNTATPYAYDARGFLKSMSTSVYAVHVAAIGGTDPDPTAANANPDTGSGWASNTINGYSLALLSTGDVLVMGKCNTGQCGTGSTQSTDGLYTGTGYTGGGAGKGGVYRHDGPSTSGTLLKVVQVAGAPTHSCVLLNTGRVRCAGSAGSGEQGIAGLGAPNRLNPITALHDFSGVQATMAAPYNTWALRVTQVVTGLEYTCFLLNTGYVACTGNNAYGIIGNGAAAAQIFTSPLYLVDLGGDTALQISAGLQHACAVTISGNAYCWGRNHKLQLGSANAGANVTASFTPKQFTPPPSRSAVQVSCGAVHTCVVWDDGSATCAGQNLWGELANGNSAQASVANPLTPNTVVTGGIASIWAGPTAYATCILKTDNSAACLGHNYAVGTAAGANNKVNPTTSAQTLTIASTTTAGVAQYLPWPAAQAMRPLPAIHAVFRPDDSWTAYSVNVWMSYDRSAGADAIRVYFDDVACTNTLTGAANGLNASTVVCSISSDDMLRLTRLPLVTVSWTGAPSNRVYGFYQCPRPVLQTRTVLASSTSSTSFTFTGVCINTGAGTPAAYIAGHVSAVVTASSFSSITIVIPPGAGNQSLAIANQGLAHSMSPTSIAIVYPSPVASRIWTALGNNIINAVGETIVVFGSGFGPSNFSSIVSATLDGRICAGTVINDTAIALGVPGFVGSYTGILQVWVENIAVGTFATAYLKPTLTGISPSNTYTLISTTNKNFTITGTYFGARQADITNVTLGGKQCTAWTRLSSTAINCTMGSAAMPSVANGNVVVTIAGYTTAPLTATLLTVYPAPAITAVTIRTNPVSTADPVWYDGNSLGYGPATVYNATGNGGGNAPIVSFRLWSTVSGYLPCSMVLFPTVLGQTIGCMASTIAYQYYGVGLTPSLVLENGITVTFGTVIKYGGNPTLSPTVPTALGSNRIRSIGETVVLTGSSFGAAGWVTAVQVNGVNTTFTHVNDTTITNVVVGRWNATGGTGQAVLRVFTTGQYASGFATLTYDTPNITSVTPSQSYATTGLARKTFVVLGSGFGSSQSDIAGLTIGGANCSAPVRVNATNITCTFTAAQMTAMTSVGAKVTLVGGAFDYEASAFTSLGTPKIDSVALKPSDTTAPAIFMGSALGYGLSKVQTTNNLTHANAAVVVYAGFYDAANKSLPCVTIDFPVTLGQAVICTPHANVTTTALFRPYVQLEENITVIGSAVSFAAQTNQLAVSWVTTDLSATALPSSSTVHFYTSPQLQVIAMAVSGAGLSVPLNPVTCALVLDSTSLPPGSTINTMLVGTPSVSLTGSSFTFPAGIMGRSNWNYTLTAQCSYGGLGPWFVTPTSIRVRVGRFGTTWVVGAANGTLTSSKASKSNPTGALTSLSPAPTVSLTVNYGYGWQTPTMAPDEGTLAVPCTATPYTTTSGEYVDYFGTNVVNVDNDAATASFAAMGVVGSLGVAYNVNATCSWVTGEALVTATTNATRLARVAVAWLYAPNTTFVFNTPTAPSVLLFTRFSTSTNTWVPLTDASVTADDVTCTVAASMLSGSVPVTFLGGDTSAFDPSNGTMSVGAMSFLPVYQSVTGTVRVDTVVQCTFREQALNALNTTSTMQTLTLGWVSPPPISLVSSSSAQTFVQPALSFALRDGFNSAIDTDSSTTCTLALASAADLTGKSVRASVDRTTSTTLSGGLGLLDDWIITSPLQAAVQLKIYCSRAQGGPTISLAFNATVQGAEVNWKAWTSLNSSYGRALAMYVLPTTVVASVSVRNTTSSTRASQYTLATYSPVLYPAASCSLSIDTSVAAAANALLSGDPLSYQSQAVNGTGFVTFSVQLAATPGYAVPLQINCAFGDASITTASFLTMEVASVNASWNATLPTYYTFNTLTPAIGVSFAAVVPANASRPAWLTPIVGTGITTTDIACTLAAVLSGTNTSVGFTGGQQAGGLDVAKGSLTMGGVALAPDDPVPGTRVAVTASCIFRKSLVIAPITFVARQQLLSLRWLSAPAASVVASSSTQQLPLSALQLRLEDEFATPLSLDSTSQCTLAVASAATSTGAVVSGVTTGGSIQTTAAGGIVTFPSWYVTAPINTLVTLSVTCRRKERGPDITITANVTTAGAEVNWYNASTLYAAFPRPVLLYETPSPVVARVMVRQPRFNNGTTPYSLVAFDGATHPACTCNLQIDSSTPGGANAVLSGNPSLYSKQRVNATGMVSFNARLTATAELAVYLRMTCTFGDNAIQTSTLAVQIAYVVASWVRRPPTVFIYNTPTSPAVFQLFAKIPGNATLNTSDVLIPTYVAAISASDLACSTTVVAPSTGATMSFSGGNAGAVDPATGTVQISGFAIAPPVYAPGALASIAADCTFKKYMAVPRLAQNTTMQAISLVWTSPPPASMMPASSTQVVYAPSIALALVNSTGGVLDFDSTATCTLRVTSALSRSGLPLAQAAAVGTTKVTAAAGAVTFAAWGVQSALGSLVNVTVTCTRQEGGVDVMNTTTIALYDATSSMASITSIGVRGVSTSPTLVYDTPATLLVQLSLRRQTTATLNAAFTPVAYGGGTAQATTCTAAVATAQATVPVSINGPASGYQSVAANATGFVSLTLRLAAQAALLLPLTVTCRMGDTTLAALPVTVVIAPLQLRVFSGTTAAGAYLPPPAGFIYNEPMAPSTFQVLAVVNASTNATIPLPVLPGMTPADLSCSVDASSSATGTPRSVPLPGATVGAWTLADATVQLYGAQPQPPYTGVAGDVDCKLSLTCSFRTLRLGAASFTAYMQNLTLSWDVLPLPTVGRSTTSSPPRLFPLAPFSISLRNASDGVCDNDNTGTCTLQADGSLDSKGNLGGAQSVVLGGTTTVRLTGGVATFTGITVNAPLLSVAYLSVTCSPGNGGPAVTTRTSVAVHGARMTWGQHQTLDVTGAAVAAYYDTPSNVTAIAVLLVPTSRSNASVFASQPFSADAAPSPTCSLSIASYATTVSAGLGGDARAYQNQPVDAAGRVVFAVRLQAPSRTDIPLVLDCKMGDYVLDQLVLIMRVSSIAVVSLQAWPQLAVPSSATHLEPIAPSLQVRVVDDYGGAMTDDPGATCAIAGVVYGLQVVGSTWRMLSADEIDAEAYPCKLDGPSAGNAGVTLAGGVATFVNLGVAVEHATLVAFTITCRRSSAGADSALLTANTTFSTFVAQYAQLPPAKVLYNTYAPVSVRLLYQTALGADWQLQPYNSTAVTAAICSLYVSDADAAAGISLGGGARVVSKQVDQAGLAQFPLQLLGDLGSTAHLGVSCEVLGSSVVVDFQANSTIQALTTRFLDVPPTRTWPTSGALTTTVSPFPSVVVTSSTGEAVDNTGIRCAVTIPRGANVTGYLYSPYEASWPPRIRDSPDFYSYSPATGRVTIDRLHLSAWWNVTVPLQIACTRPQGDTIPALPLPMHVPAVGMVWVLPPPETVPAKAKMLMQLVVVDLDYGVIDTANNYTMCSASNDRNAPLQYADAQAVNGIVTFPTFQLLGDIGRNYTVRIACQYGDIPYPLHLFASILIAGCLPGEAPFGGSSCTPCGANMYSDGGNSPCIKCPFGVECTGGLLAIQQGFYLSVPSDAYSHPDKYNLTVLPGGRIVPTITPTTELHTCWTPDSCAVNASERSFGCAEGYRGVLCGVCDEDDDYVRSGQTCTKCLHKQFNQLMLAGGLLVVFLVLVYVSIGMDFGSSSQGKIVWRVAVNYVSALAMLATYVARGTSFWLTASTYLQSLVAPGSGAGLEVSPIQCILKLSFYFRFTVTMNLPILCGFICIVINLLDIIRYKGPEGCAGIVAEWKAFFVSSKWFAVVSIVLFMAYPALMKEAFKMFQCTPALIGGLHWLEADLSVQCDSTKHAIGSLMSWVAIGLLAGGLPVLFAWYLYRHEGKVKEGPASPFFSLMGFLYQGYKTDKWYLYSWEALLMVRKACLVAIAATTKDPIYQCCSAILLLVASFGLQLHLAPYKRPLFNWLEAATLLVLIITLAVSLMYLRASTLITVATSSLYPSAMVSTAQRDLAASPGMLTEAATTALLIIVNVTMMLVLIHCFVYVKLAETAGDRSCWYRFKHFFDCVRSNNANSSIEQRKVGAKITKLASRLALPHAGGAPKTIDVLLGTGAVPKRVTANPLLEKAREAEVTTERAPPRPPPKPPRLAVTPMAVRSSELRRRSISSASASSTIRTPVPVAVDSMAFGQVNPLAWQR